MSLGLALLEIAGVATLLVRLALFVLHLLLINSPSLQLLSAALLGRPQPLQAGHLVQLLQLLDQLQVVGHGAKREGRQECVERWSVILARAAPSAMASTHQHHHHPHHPFSSSKHSEESERKKKIYFTTWGLIDTSVNKM